MSKLKKSDNSLKFNIIISLLITIIGAALWDFLLYDFFKNIYVYILEVSAPIANKYVDSIYSEVSNGFHEYPSMMSYSIIIIVFISVSVYISIKGIQTSKSNMNRVLEMQSKLANAYTKKEIAPLSSVEDLKLSTEKLLKEEVKISKAIRIMSVVSFFFFIVLLQEIVKYGVINEMQTKTIANIEIVSPYITDMEYKSLKSDFYSINSQSDYQLLQSELQMIASNNNIVLKN